MRKPAIAGATALALTLAACASTSGTSTAPTLTLAQVVADAELAAQAVCAVAPTATSITSIILAAENSASATLDEQTATAAANAFCQGVTGKTVSVKYSSRHDMKIARGVIRATTPMPVGGSVFSYGTITINGKPIQISGTPLS